MASSTTRPVSSVSASSNPALMSGAPVGQLLAVLLLREVLVSEPAPEVADVPPAVLDHRNLGFGRAGQGGLVERVRDQLPEPVSDRPVFEHPLDVEVELAGRDSSAFAVEARAELRGEHEAVRKLVVRRLPEPEAGIPHEDRDPAGVEADEWQVAIAEAAAGMAPDGPARGRPTEQTQAVVNRPPDAEQ
jgi:hypothetical protein